ncbi:hypothetical protein GOBAR_DD12729 [Gossypium barbadense]|nr:hypothetical protein GOBAR_DD12729 [Gossypium barbadense]
MNVMPTIAEKDTLGVISDRGLIGIYHDWCEAFSTYPRTYDLIHANGIFSLYKDKCKAEDILLEMDRILRPEGSVIIRDNVNVLVKVKKIVGGMRWDARMVDHEDGPLVSEKTNPSEEPLAKTSKPTIEQALFINYHTRLLSHLIRSHIEQIIIPAYLDLYLQDTKL